MPWFHKDAKAKKMHLIVDSETSKPEEGIFLRLKPSLHKVFLDSDLDIIHMKRKW